MNSPLPPTLSSKFEALARRVRHAQLVRGASIFLLVVTFGQFALFLLDFVMGFEPRGYRFALFLLLMSALVVVSRRLIVPLARPVRLSWLAALVEQRYPSLQEKLVSAVAFSEKAQPEHGSPKFIATVVEQATMASASLDFRESYSTQPARRWGQGAAIAVVATLVLSVAWPAYAGFEKDLWCAWSLPAGPFVFDVSPGTATVARDRAVKVMVQIAPAWSRAILPRTCVLLLQRDAGFERVPMSAEGEGFSVVLDRVPEKLTYHVEAGGQSSEVFTLTGIEPIQLAAGSPKVVVTPPSYVNPTAHPQQSYIDTAHFLALQYSTMRIDFEVNRRPAKAHAVISQDHGAATRAAVVWDDDTHGHVDWIAANKGKFTGKLLFEDVTGLTFEHDLPPWSVWRDEAPVVLEMPLRLTSTKGQTVAPDDHLPLRVVVEDLVGLDRVDLEYRINDGPVTTTLLTAGEGTVRLSRLEPFALAGKVKEGDTFSWRLKVTDNRRLKQAQLADSIPERDLPPQVTYDPAPHEGKDRWQTLHISQQSDPFAEQQIAAQRDAVDKKITALKLQIEQERASLSKAKVGSHQQSVLSQSQVQEIDQVRAKNKANQDSLRKFGWELGADPFLSLLAQKPLALAEGELVRSDTQLSQAGDKRLAPDVRENKLDRADQELVQALKALEEMRTANDRLAQNRFDQAKMENLARKQDDLARRAAELAKLDLSKDPAAQAELARLKEEQAKLAAELERLGQNSKLFQEALQKARVQQAQQMSRQAEKLAQAQRDNFQATQKALMEELRKKLAEIAGLQEALAGRSADLGKDAKVPVGETVPRFDEAKSAAGALREGLVERALNEQEKTMKDLSGLAGSIARGILLGRNPREGARNLAAFQDRLEKDLERLGESPPGVDEVQRRLRTMLDAQKLLQDSLARLDIPADLKDARAQRDFARDLAGQAANLFRQDAFAVLEKMKETQQAVKKLVQQLPADLASANVQATPLEKLSQAQSEKAVGLAREQKDLRDAVLKLLGQAAGGEGKGDSPLHGAAEKQKDLKKDSEMLGTDLLKLAQKAGSPEAKMAAEEAARAADDAARAMTQSKEKMEEGKMTEAEKLAEEAALKLEIAGKRANDSAQEMQAKLSDKTPDGQGDPAADALTQAQQHMNQAQNKLDQGQPMSAQPAMQQSAQALQRAAQKAGEQLMQTRSPSSNPFSNKQGAPAGGVPTQAVLAQELAKYGAVSWGELPGELRTRIVQDMRARYGEDYARIIQGYFQGIAEAPAGKGP